MPPYDKILKLIEIQKITNRYQDVTLLNGMAGTNKSGRRRLTDPQPMKEYQVRILNL